LRVFNAFSSKSYNTMSIIIGDNRNLSTKSLFVHLVTKYKVNRIQYEFNSGNEAIVWNFSITLNLFSTFVLYI